MQVHPPGFVLHSCLFKIEPRCLSTICAEMPSHWAITFCSVGGRVHCGEDSPLYAQRCPLIGPQAFVQSGACRPGGHQGSPYNKIFMSP